MADETKPELTDGQRLVLLEERVKLHDAFQEKHLRAISIIFGFSSLLLVVITYLAKTDVSGAARDMEHRFEVLANQTLKRPVLVIQYDGLPLEGRTIEVKGEPNNPRVIRLKEFEVKNSGDGPTAGLLSMKAYLSEDVQNLNANLESASPKDEYGKGFVMALFYGVPLMNISPRQTWWMTGGSVQVVLGGNVALPHDLRARAVVFYGTDNPAVADFTIRVAP